LFHFPQDFVTQWKVEKPKQLHVLPNALIFCSFIFSFNFFLNHTKIKTFTKWRSKFIWENHSFCFSLFIMQKKWCASDENMYII
jgi:hypothetical protein